MALQVETMILAAANPARSLVFFPASGSSVDDTWLCYNYKTGQWTRVSAYDGERLYSLNDEDKDIGVIVYSSVAVDLQDQATSYPAQEANIETAYRNINQGGRSMITGVRPLVEGAAGTVAVDTRQTRQSRTNVFLHSEDFSQSNYTKGSVTVNTNATTAPDGETTADEITEDNTGPLGQHRVICTGSGTDGELYTFSIYAKANTRDAIYITGGGQFDGYYFDLANGVLGDEQGTSSITNPGIIDVGDGWYRCYGSREAASSTSRFDVYLANGTTSGSNQYDGDGSSSIYLWGAMSEKASFPGTYIPSGSTAGTEDEDSGTFTDINPRSGMANFRREGRYHRLKLNVTGGFETIVGADVQFSPTGRI